MTPLQDDNGGHESDGSAPLISCVIPVWNCEQYLGEAIDSVLGQTYRNIELIVVDDGSTDGTADVISRYGTAIRACRQEHAGAGAARNAGIHAALGQFIAFLDADDLWAPNKLERQMDCLLAADHHEMCIVGIQNFWIPELAAERDAFADRELARPQVGYSFSCILARRTAFERVGKFNPLMRMREDREWFVRARDMGVGISVVSEVLVRRRIHFSNWTRRFGPEALDELFHIARTAIARRGAPPQGDP